MEPGRDDDREFVELLALEIEQEEWQTGKIFSERAETVPRCSSTAFIAAHSNDSANFPVQEIESKQTKIYYS